MDRHEPGHLTASGSQSAGMAAMTSRSESAAAELTSAAPVSWTGLPRDVLLRLLAAVHPRDRPNTSLVCKTWLRCHDELVTVLTDPQPIVGVRFAPLGGQNVDPVTLQTARPRAASRTPRVSTKAAGKPGVAATVPVGSRALLCRRPALHCSRH